MNRRIPLGLALLGLIFAAVPVSAQAARRAVVTAANVQLMAQPSFSADTLISVEQGSELRVLEVDEEWVRVFHEQRQGFVHAAFVSVVAGEPQQQKVATPAAAPPAAAAPAAARAEEAAGDPDAGALAYSHTWGILTYGRIMAGGGSVSTIGSTVSAAGALTPVWLDYGWDAVIPEANASYTQMLFTAGVGYTVSSTETSSLHVAGGIAPSWLISQQEGLESDFSLLDVAYVKGGFVWHPSGRIFSFGKSGPVAFGLMADLGIRLPLEEGDSSTFFRIGAALNMFKGPGS